MAYQKLCPFERMLHTLYLKITLETSLRFFDVFQLRHAFSYSKMFSLHLYSVDIPSCGRVDVSSLSDQTRMELLVADIQHLSAVQSTTGEFLDIKKWRGVDIIDDYVDYIVFNHTDIFIGEDDFVVGPGGSIDLRWLPSKLAWLDLHDMLLEGTIETTDLPRDLKYVDLTRNNLKGTLCMIGLPQNIQKLRIGDNKLSGSLHLEHSPPNLVAFDAHWNGFEGTLDFRHLPERMDTLNLRDNKFSGSIDLSKIPSSLTHVYFNRTQISQETLVIAVPTNGIDRFYVDKDRFDRIVDTNGRDIKGMLYPQEK